MGGRCIHEQCLGLSKSNKALLLKWCWPCILRLYWSKYSRMDQVKFLEDSLSRIWSDMVCLSRPYHFKFFKGWLLILFPYSRVWFFIYVELCAFFIQSFKMVISALPLAIYITWFLLTTASIQWPFLFSPYSFSINVDSWPHRKAAFYCKILSHLRLPSLVMD